MRTLFVIDIDNTLADASRRMKKAGLEPDRDIDKEAHNQWLLNVQSEQSISEDKSVPGMRDLVDSLDFMGVCVVYITARQQGYFDVTQAWLRDEGFPIIQIIMRPEGNTDRSGIYKEKMIKLTKAFHNCDTVVVIDDDERDELRNICYLNSWTFLKAFPGLQK